MKGLFLKDLFILRQYGKTFLVVIAAFVIFSMIFAGGAGGSYGVIISFLFAMLPLITFSYDTASGWNTYAMTLPVGRRSLVSSKYLLAFLSAVAGTAVAFLADLAGRAAHGGFNWKERLLTAYLILLVILLFQQIMLPLMLKLGPEKGRVIMMLLFAVPFLAVFLLMKSGMPIPGEEAIRKAAFLAPLLIVVLEILSFLISCRICEKQEL